MIDEFMQAAIAEADSGQREGGIPIGSVLVHRGRILGRGHNRRVQRGSVVLHGEMDALENAGRQSASVYRGSILYTTLSPCAMCTGAILLYGIPRLIVGENRTFVGEEALLRSRGVSVEVLQDPTCVRLMSSFIQQHPELWNEDIGVWREYLSRRRADRGEAWSSLRREPLGSALPACWIAASRAGIALSYGGQRTIECLTS
jgi:creatinine deaminase